MVIRGAPAIGVAAAMGVALGIERSTAKTGGELRPEFSSVCNTIAQTRPTAVDLFWAIERMTRRFEQLMAADVPLDSLRRAMVGKHELFTQKSELRTRLSASSAPIDARLRPCHDAV